MSLPPAGFYVPRSPAPSPTAGVRRAPPADGLDAGALSLLDELPAGLRMLATRRQYPHVLNRIAAAWTRPRAFAAVLDDLLVDRRGGRLGFPPDVRDELLALQRHYFLSVRPDAGRTPVTRGRADASGSRG